MVFIDLGKSYDKAMVGLEEKVCEIMIYSCDSGYV